VENNEHKYLLKIEPGRRTHQKGRQAAIIGKSKRKNLLKPEKKFTTALALGFSFLLLSVLAACTSSLFSYRGQTANPQSRIALQEGLHKAVWSTDDLSVEYSYSRNSNNLRISGQVELSNELKDVSDVVANFFLQVVFLNADGRASDTEELVAAGYGEPITKWQFDRTYVMPANAAAMAFSYDGQMGLDPLRGATKQFWHDPFH
jgi:hypothetical protein